MARRTIRVGVLFGGQSSEHEVSLASAHSVMRALEACDDFEVVPIGITRSGRWLVGAEAHPALIAQAKVRLGEPPPPPRDISRGAEPVALLPDGGERALLPIREGGEARPVDVIFPVLHGPKGEDGTVQGFLELAGIPYVGSGVAASAVGMDKDLMKRLFRDAGLRTAEWITVRKGRWKEDRETVLREASRIGFPCFVKPANLGSSVGIGKAKDGDGLARAIDEAALYDLKILVERAVDAREIECSVLGNDDPRASVPGEVVSNREFYDYRAKYIDGASRLLIPAPIPPETAEEVRRVSVEAFRTLDCAGMARVDFFLDRGTGELYINELNTIPGFTSISMYNKLWEASGVGYTELVVRLVQLALERYRERKDLDLSPRIGEADGEESA
ncbi:MAG: D-alanine--D-alanine ligase [Candidatus Eisenbacteria bacterium]|nr:D-alanine--D-alanine ligase [Candidatus Eisenbacteria bacterium]